MISVFKKACDPISSYTHFVGACLSFIGLLFFVVLGILFKSPVTSLLGSIVFGISLIMLYMSSSIYHFFNGKETIKKKLRKLDHAMIYVLIVGTYTPVTLAFVEYQHAIVFLTVLWTIAIAGILIKIFWINAPRFLSTLIYLLLGWAIVFDIRAFMGIPFNCLLLIALGGIAYSIGAIIYIIKKPNISELFGFHELFHIFVMIGSFMHYLAVMLYVL